MKRYKPVFMTEHEEGDWVSYSEHMAREQYWRDWNGRAANRAAVLEAQRDRLLVLATKWCPSNHHDWKEILDLGEGTHLPEEDG